MVDINNTCVCDKWMDNLVWSSLLGFSFIGIISIIEIVIIIGNILVLIAVCCNSKLKITLNMYIINMVIANLLIAITKIPLSAYLRFKVNYI